MKKREKQRLGGRIKWKKGIKSRSENSEIIQRGRKIKILAKRTGIN